MWAASCNFLKSYELSIIVYMRLYILFGMKIKCARKERVAEVKVILRPGMVEHRAHYGAFLWCGLAILP